MKRSSRQSELTVAALLSAAALSFPAVMADGSVVPPPQPLAAPGQAARAATPMSAPGRVSATSALPAAPGSPLSTFAGPAAPASAGPTLAAPPGSAGPSGGSAHAEQASLALGVLQNLKPPGWLPAETKVYAAPPPAPVAMPSLGGNDLVASLLKDPNPALTAAPTQKSFANGTTLPLSSLSDEMDAQKVAMLQEFGCSSLYSRSFQRGQRRLLVRIFQFNSSDGAFGAYSLLRQGATTVVQRGDASSEDEQSISFWQGRCFISVSGTSQDDEESKNLVRDIADKLSAVLREHAPLPSILQRLPHFERVRASERIVMGPQSTRRFFPAPYLQSVDFARSRSAAIADYQVQDPPDRLKMLLIEYPTAQTALTAYYKYTGNFDEHLIAVEAPSGGAAAVYKVNKNFLLCQTRGAELVIITGARRRESALFLARYMY